MAADGASQAAFERAKTLIPGGVNSPVRAFLAVGGTPRFIARARGPYLYDLDGNELVDLICSWGPMLHGHAHPEVIEAVRRAAEHGTSYGAPTLGRGGSGRRDRRPDPGRAGPAGQQRHRSHHVGAPAGPRRHRSRQDHQVRRLLPRPRRRPARRGRLRGGHLSHRAGSRVAGRHPRHPRRDRGTTADTIVLPYNDRAAVREAFATYGDEIACGDHRGRGREHGGHPAGGRGRDRLQRLLWPRSAASTVRCSSPTR